MPLVQLSQLPHAAQEGWLFDPAIQRLLQGKGAEARAVFVILEEEQLDHILVPASDNEEQRTTYVARRLEPYP